MSYPKIGDSTLSSPRRQRSRKALSHIQNSSRANKLDPYISANVKREENIQALAQDKITNCKNFLSIENPFLNTHDLKTLKNIPPRIESPRKKRSTKALSHIQNSSRDNKLDPCISANVKREKEIQALAQDKITNCKNLLPTENTYLNTHGIKTRKNIPPQIESPRKQRSRKAPSHKQNSSRDNKLDPCIPANAKREKEIQTLAQDKITNCKNLVPIKNTYLNTHGIKTRKNRSPRIERARSSSPRKIKDPNGECTTQWVIKKKKIVKVLRNKEIWVDPPSLNMEETKSQEEDIDDLMGIMWNSFKQISNLCNDDQNHIDGILNKKQKKVNYMYKINEENSCELLAERSL